MPNRLRDARDVELQVGPDKAEVRETRAVC